MLNWLYNNIFEADQPLSLEDEQEQVVLLRNILYIAIPATVILSVFLIFFQSMIQAAILFGLLIVFGLSYLTLQRGNTALASFAIPLSVMIAMGIISINAFGLHDSSITGFSIVIVVASLTMGRRGTLIFGALVSIMIAFIGILEMSGLAANKFSDATSTEDIIIISAIVIIIAVIQNLLINRLYNKALAEKNTVKEKIRTNQELSLLRETLEEQVETRTAELSQRTSELEKTNAIMIRTARQFEAVSEIARAISTIHDMQELLKKITFFISNEFGFYHVGIFLIDETKTFAILSASNSDGGQKMALAKYRLKITDEGIVENAAKTGKMYFIPDISQEPLYRANENLIDTRSEIVLPLISEKKVLGILDIHSTELNGFSAQDINALTALADLVSIAIENVRLYEENARALTEAEAITKQYVRAQWSDIANQQGYVGYVYDVTGSSVLDKPMDKKSVRQVVQKGQIYMGEDEKKIPSLAVPIKLRDQVIGVINISTPGKRRWSHDEIDLAKAIAERLAISAENARLFDVSQERAVTEQTIGQISAKLSTSINISAVMQTAVEELGRVLSGSEVAIQLLNPDEQAK